MSINKRAVTFKFARITSATIILVAFLMPWIKVFERGYINGLEFTFLFAGSSVANPSFISNLSDFLWYMVAIIIFVCLASAMLFAVNELIFSLFERYVLNIKMRKVFRIAGFIGLMATGILLYLSVYNGASRIVGVEIGYWFSWLGLISGLVVELLENRRLPFAQEKM